MTIIKQTQNVLSSGVWHQSPTSSQEANWKHGQGVYSREAERTAGLSGFNHPASHAFQLPDCQEVPGSQQLLCQLHRCVFSSSLRDYFQFLSFRGVK